VKVLEHNMTKEIFLEIVKSNLTAEYINNTKQFAKGVAPPPLLSLTHLAAQREEDWDRRIKEVMARRIQNMAHLWFGRRSRTKFAWKSEQKRVNQRRFSRPLPPPPLTVTSSTLKQTLVTFMSRKLRGFRARCRFE
jgi:hypothetical protein